MGCNCKRAVELNENYGEKVEYGVSSKALHYIKKAFTIAFVFAATILMTPVAIIYVMIQVLFRKDNMVILPDALAKYTVRKDGQGLQGKG